MKRISCGRLGFYIAVAIGATAFVNRIYYDTWMLQTNMIVFLGWQILGLLFAFYLSRRFPRKS